MPPELHIAILGDFRPENHSHRATNRALEHAAAAASREVRYSWIPSPSLVRPDLDNLLEAFDGYWCAPGSPYASMEGALRAIYWIREHDRPYLAT